MWINIIDYRGDDTIINTRNETLFNYRTRYLFRIQEDFYHWKKHGHKFRCFTQHDNRNDIINDYSEFNDVVKIPRGNAASSRNLVLDYYSKDEWIGIWDNDASVYFDKLDTKNFIRDLDAICQEAEQLAISSFVPFNAQQAPYPLKPKRWKPKLEQKTTQLWCCVDDWRFDDTLECLEDLEFACRLALQGKKFAQTELCSLKEYVNGKSTIFVVNEHHKAYKKPGPGANPNGLKQWDAQLDRVEKYDRAKQQIETKLGYTIKEIKEIHKKLWEKK